MSVKRDEHRGMQILFGCTPATDVFTVHNFTLLNSDMYSVRVTNVVSTIIKAVIIQLTFTMNPFRIFWLHKALVNVHEWMSTRNHGNYLYWRVTPKKDRVTLCA